MKNKWIKFLLKSTITIVTVALAQELVSAFVSRPAAGFYLAVIGLLWVAYFAWQAYLTPEEDSADKPAAEQEESGPSLNETLEALGNKWEASLNKLHSTQDQRNQSIREALKNIEDKVSAWGESLRTQAEKYGTLLENQLVTSSESLKQVAQNVEQQSGRALTESGEILKGHVTAMQQEFKNSAGDLRRQFLETAAGLQQKFTESAKSLWEDAAQDTTKKSEVLEQWIRERMSQMEEASQKLVSLEEWLRDRVSGMEGASQKLTAMTEGLSSVNKVLTDSAENAEVNQVEFRASIDSLNKAMGELLVKVEAQAGGRSEEENFVQRLNETLEAFHERATEILIENAEKTRDILAEALAAVQHKNEVVS